MHTQPYSIIVFISGFVIHSKHVDANVWSDIHGVKIPSSFSVVLDSISLKEQIPIALLLRWHTILSPLTSLETRTINIVINWGVSFNYTKLGPLTYLKKLSYCATICGYNKVCDWAAAEPRELKWLNIMPPWDCWQWNGPWRGRKKRWAWPQVACNHIRAEGWTK